MPDANGWIAVEERLPEGYLRVLVIVIIDNTAYGEVAIYRPEYQSWFGDSSYETDDVTHWMPIPPLPSETKKVKTVELGSLEVGTEFRFDEAKNADMGMGDTVCEVWSHTRAFTEYVARGAGTPSTCFKSRMVVPVADTTVEEEGEKKDE